MSKYRKPFLKCFSEMMAMRLPQWRRGVCTPVAWARPDGTFSDAESFSKFGLSFHLVVEFSSKWTGAFTGDIVVAGSPEGFGPKVKFVHRSRKDVPELLEGVYRIGWFYVERDVWWHLVDEEAEAKRFWGSFPNVPGGSLIMRKKHDWYASSYDVPFEHVISEAAKNFCDTFEHQVIPNLKGRSTGCSE